MELQRLPEPIRLVTSGAFLASVPSTQADLLALARGRAADPAVFDEKTPYFWGATISTNQVDFYGTRMAPDTLHNFAQALNDGVAYQHSHDVREFIGHSLAGEVVQTGTRDASGIDGMAVNGVFFTMPDIKLGSMATNDFITATRAGVLRDVSVGFWADDIRCSLCGGQLFYSNYYGWDGTCSHVPTLTYDVLDPQGKPVRDAAGNVQQQQCWGWVHNGSLGETSSVYDGATPGAAVYKASLMAEAGLLDVRQASALEARFRVRLPDQKRQYRGITMDQEIVEQTRAPEETPVETVEEQSAPTADPVIEAWVAEGERFKRHGITVTAGDAPLLPRQVAEALERQSARIIELEAEAAIGRQYKADLIDEALKDGVRAKGDGFKAELYRGILAALGVSEIRAMRDDWRSEGDRWAAGATGQAAGRRSVDVAEPAPQMEQRRKPAPDHIYAG